jgi:hypothetical protein
MKRRLLVGVIALGLFGGGVFAQDHFFAFRGAFIDIPITSPCLATVRSASMTVYDGNAWVVYTCSDGNAGQVVLRRYLNPNDNVKAPVAVYTVEDPNASGEPQNPSLAAGHTPGMITSIYGGCVPPDHPSAPR